MFLNSRKGSTKLVHPRGAGGKSGPEKPCFCISLSVATESISAQTSPIACEFQGFIRGFCGRTLLSSSPLAVFCRLVHDKY